MRNIINSICIFIILYIILLSIGWVVIFLGCSITNPIFECKLTVDIIQNSKFTVSYFLLCFLLTLNLYINLTKEN